MTKPTLTIKDIQQLHQAGLLNEAKQGYLDILKINPNDVAALHMLAVLYAEEGDLDEATRYLEKAIALHPDDPALRLHLANVFKAKGLLTQAAQVLHDVIQNHPKFAAAYNNLGTIYYAQAKLSEAIKAYQSAIDLQSDYADAYYNLGLALNKFQHRSEAMNAFQALIELNPQHAGGHFQLGCLLMEKHKFQKAIEHFLVIESQHPAHFETQTNLATAYLRLGKLNEAKQHYLKALALNATDSQVLFNLGVIAMQQGLLPDAIGYYSGVIKILPDNYEAYYNLGFANLVMQNSHDALAYFREALRIQPNNASLRHTINILAQNKSLSSSPPEYISALFDSYADHYDSHLVKTLHYQVPQLFYQCVQEINNKPQQAWDILDLGCGTGLSGELFKPYAKSLVGVDLSEKMLQAAALKNYYDQLFQADVIEFLKDKNSTYDLVIAADLVVYFGNLTPLFKAVAQALKPKGMFVFNAEINAEENFQIGMSGRFSHSKKYLEQLISQYRLKPLHYRAVIMRTQNHQPVVGHLYLLQKDF